ncbi:MAG: lysophospholipid acyltransferase family protein [Pseudomonadota bacterium]
MTKFILRFFHIVAFYSVLIWLAIMLLIVNFVVFFLYYLLPPDTGKIFGRKLNSFVFRLFLNGCCHLGLMHLDLHALDKLNVAQGIIIAPNHPSMLDALLILSRIKNTSCLMKTSLWNNIFLHSGARLAGYVRNDSIKNMVRRSVKELQSGSNLLIFPEGTRTVQLPINRLKTGVGFISTKAQAPIQTVLLLTDSPYLSKHWPIWKTPSFPVYFKAVIGQRFEPTSRTAEITSLLQNYYDRTLDDSIHQPRATHT